MNYEISEEEGIYYLCSENKGAGQLPDYHKAGLGLVFAYADCWFSNAVAHLCSRFADKFSKHMKWFLLILFILGGGCFLVFALYLVHIVPDLKGKKQLSFSGASCSKLTTSLVNVSLKFQTLILQIHCHFLLKKCENPLHCKGFSHFFNKK